VFRMGDVEYELSWLAPANLRWHVLIEFACGPYKAALALDGLAAADPRLVGEPFELMPPPLRNLAIHGLMAHALSNAPPSVTQALDIRAVHWEPDSTPDWQCQLSFSLTRRPEGTRMLGLLLFETAAALQWLHQSLPVDATSGRTRLTLHLPLRLILGRSSVVSDALVALAPGDVVWVETARMTRDGVAIELLAPLARRAWLCRAHRSELRIVRADDAEIWTMDAPGGAQRTQATGGRFMSAERAMLETPVTFDLGELNMKVQELERLQPGQIIELPQDVATATIALRVGGRRIAEGTLIAVGRRLGVRISRICGATG
jgi:type III secretion system YscQ/HrcQ family protein